MHTMEYYSVIKKNENHAIAATWMDPEMVILSKGRQIACDIAYMWNIKITWYKGTYLQNRNRLTD